MSFQRKTGIYALLAMVMAIATALTTADWLLHYPYKASFQTELSKPNKRLTGRLVLVVVDGLNLQASKKMPFLNQLRLRGTDLVAITEQPSWSRVAYSVIVSGARPEVSGASSNLVKENHVDTIFHRSLEAGQRTAFVGSSWWLQHFGDGMQLASIESNIKKPAKKKHVEPGAVKPGCIRRVEVEGRHIDINESPLTYFARNQVGETWGDNPATEPDERKSRANEAVRILKHENIDLLVVHLDAPDHSGHLTGSIASQAYRRATLLEDQNIARIASAMNFKNDTLVVTADHGFTDSIVYGGHGGYEDDVIQVPIIMAGRGIKSYRGRAKQIDLAATINVLLGTSFTMHNQGRIIFSALSVDEKTAENILAEKRLQEFRFYRAYQQNRFLADASGVINLVEAKKEVERQRLFYQLRNNGWQVLLCLVLMGWFIFVLRQRSFSWLEWWWAFLAWLSFEVFFVTIYLLIFKNYSLSAFTDPVFPALGMFVISLVAFFAGPWLVRHLWKKSFHLSFELVFFKISLKTFFLFSLLGITMPLVMPSGFILFAAVAMNLQTAAAALFLLVSFLVAAIKKKPRQGVE